MKTGFFGTTHERQKRDRPGGSFSHLAQTCAKSTNQQALQAKNPPANQTGRTDHQPAFERRASNLRSSIPRKCSGELAMRISRSLLPAFSLVVLASLFHLLVAPYTKVEESFTLHAVWDILTHGRNLSRVYISTWL